MNVGAEAGDAEILSATSRMPDGSLQCQVRGETFKSNGKAPEPMDIGTIETWCQAVRAYARSVDERSQVRNRSEPNPPGRSPVAESPVEYVQRGHAAAAERYVAAEIEYLEAENDLRNWDKLRLALEIPEIEEKDDG